ncbi:hypothetical protein B0H11DRAFT_2077471 [Mycena galericulata]|nr:hypothetical protein B0H11DRAFT_2077471 [Mycena galericulata]
MQASVSLTQRDYDEFVKKVDRYVDELANEENEKLRERTIERLKTFMAGMHGSRGLIRQWFYTLMSERAAAENADQELQRLWEAYQIESRNLRNEPTVPPPSAPLPIQGRDQSSSSDFPASPAYHRSFPPRARENRASPGSAEFYQNHGVSNPPGILPGVHHDSAPFAIHPPGQYYGSSPLPARVDQQRYMTSPPNTPVTVHSTSNYRSSGGSSEGPHVSIHNNSSSSRGSHRHSRSGSSAGYSPMQGGGPPQTMSMPGPSHAQGPSAQPYTYGVYAPGYAPGPSPGYAPPPGAGPGYGASAPAYGYYQGSNPGPSSGPYQTPFQPTVSYVCSFPLCPWTL